MDKQLCLWIFTLAAIYIKSSVGSLMPCDQVCRSGRKNNRIFGGTAVKSMEFPFIVSTRPNDSSLHNCGGALIGREWILTASHCDFPYRPILGTISITVVGGTLTSVDDQATPCEQRRDVATLFFHENFSFPGLYNDIALYRLQSPFTLTKYLMPIALPPSDLNLLPGTKCTAMGWGISEEGEVASCLLKLDVEVLDLEDCLALWEGPSAQLGDICVLPGSDKNAVCPGDSGSPLICNGQLVGITSRFNPGKSCGVDQYPMLYTPITRYLDWIKNKLEMFT